MLLSDYLKMRNQISVTTGTAVAQGEESTAVKVNSEGNTFAQELDRQLTDKTGKNALEFSNHALKRIESRSIELSDGKLERLEKAVELAAEKGSNETLVLLDSTAFVVSVKNNRVITTMSKDDMVGNVFTNIDSTVIM